MKEKIIHNIINPSGMITSRYFPLSKKWFQTFNSSQCSSYTEECIQVNATKKSSKYLDYLIS